ncbi:unnamed protein product [Adineta steineri]|uniref:RING-type domain-containing protein n=2 Tax=Adineta steineri TaxID=433720 RepID=A0A819FBT7_9BILA|nr:unnamed protein product [Adineta steineri]
MSTTSDTYECHACTFIQSIKRPTCELCESHNPYFLSENYTKNAEGATAMFDSTQEYKVVECSQCNYINIGDDIQICEGCRKNPYNVHDSPKKFRPDSGDDVIIVEDTEKSQTKPIEEKAAAAVEKGMDNKQLVPYFNRYILLIRDQRHQKQTFTVDQLHEFLTELFNTLEYKTNQSEGQLTFTTCQICYDEDKPMVTMKACNHCVLCTDDFNEYLTVRIRDGDILPWIPCPAESCSIPCHAENIVKDGHLKYFELLTFLTTYMLKKLSRNENFITCIHCERGGFLQMGPSKKQNVTCPICTRKQTIEKGVDGDLDIDFKKMIQTGQLRECPTCRHLTLKEKGVCNVIECAKCGIWWNWNTREQGHNGTDLKNRARMNGTLWEPGELYYQQQLEVNNPEEFKALLERNGITYDPNYVRVLDTMYSIANKPEKCHDCEENNNNDGWFICQECHRVFCSRHSIIHRHQLIQTPPSTERYNRHVHLDQIAEWERKAIEKIRKQADDARRPLIAPPTPMNETSPSPVLVNEQQSGPFTRLLTASSNFEKQSPIIDEYELLSDETLDEMIGNNPLTLPPDEINIEGHISFASQYPYMTGIHRLRLSIDKFNYPLSWAFIGIVSEGIQIQNQEDFKSTNRSSFGWHLGRQSIIYNRQTSTSYNYDGRHIRSGDILTIIINCNQNKIEMKNERTLYTHSISIDSNYWPFPWLFAVNFNYKNKDSMHLLK